MPASVTSSAPNGCLTFVFTSDASFNYAGFTASLTQQTTIGTATYTACPTPPANDNCSGATAFPTIPTNGTCATLSNQSTTNATNSSVTPTGACTSNSGTPDDDVWFKFVATATSHILSATYVSGNTDVYWQIFSGSCTSSMNALLCTDTDAGGTVSGLTIGQTYYVRMYSWSSSGNTVQTICMSTPPPPPANDNCSGATTFPTIPTNGTCSTLSNQSTASATQSSVTPSGACTSNYGYPDDDVWFKFVATGPVVQMSATWVSGETDIYWQVFSGSCSGTMNALLCQDTPNDSWTLSGLTTGATYYIRMYSYYSGYTTTQTICLKTPPPPPANDECSGATAFPTIPTDGTCSTLSNQSTASATQSSVIPSGACTSNYGYPDDDVWFKFVAPGPAIQMSATWVSGETDIYWQVFSGSCSATMNALICQDYPNDSWTLSGLTTGATYYIRMYSYYSGYTTTQTICLKTPPPPPANDECSGALAFPTIPSDGSCSTLSNQSTAGAYQSSVTPSGACTSNSGYPDDDVWFKFVATANILNLTATYISGETDVYFQVFSASCGSTMTSILCTDNNSGGIIGGLTIGATYYIRMYTYTSGNYSTVQTLCLSNPCPGGTPTNDLPCNAINIPLGSIVSGNNSCSYNSSEPSTPSCWTTGVYNTVWYSFVAPASGKVNVRTAPGTLRKTQIAVYSGTCGTGMTLVNCNVNAPDCGGTALDISELKLTGLISGATYYVVVDGNSDDVGTFAITAVDGNSFYPNLSGQECVTPITVCNSIIAVGDPGYQSVGFTCDNTNSSTTGSNCTTGERGSVWYRIVIDNPGTLYFDIIPNDYDGSAGNETDYDFLLWKVNGSGSTTCSAILSSGGGSTAACNYSYLGVTGLSPSGNAPAAYPGFDASYENGVTVASGDVFLLAVQNFSNSTSGFTLDFTPTASGIVNYGIPASLTWSGGANTTNWTTVANWGGCTIPTCGINAIVSPSSSFQPIITSAMGTVVVKNITIDPGATLTLGANSVLKICESLYNNGTIIADPTSTILFSDDNTTHSLNGTLSGTSRLGNLTITDIAGSTNCTVVTNTNLELSGNFTTSNSNSIFNFNGKNLILAGHFYNAAGATTFTNTTGSTITFNGAASQTYSPNNTTATPILTLNNVVINHSGPGVSIATINSPNMVLGTSGTLTLTTGKIITPNTQEVILTNTATTATTVGNTTSYVEGNLRRYLAANTTGSFDFPVGHATPGYERANVNFTSAAAVSAIQLLARFDPWGGAWPMPGAPGWGIECGIIYNAPYLNNGYWTINASAASTGNYTMTLYNRSYTNPFDYFSIAKSPSAAPAWALNGSCVPGNPVTAVQRTGMSGFSKFATIQHSTTLPVELLSFTGEKQVDDVLLKWETASEINSDYFDVERSADGINFASIGRVNAAGFSNSILNYSLLDEYPLSGNNYYRLKQVDLDNSFEYSNVVLINFDNKIITTHLESVYPNPFGDIFAVEFISALDDDIAITLLDDLGRIIMQNNYLVKTGKNTLQLNGNHLAKGMYLLRIQAEKSGFSANEKVLKK